MVTLQYRSMEDSIILDCHRLRARSRTYHWSYHGSGVVVEYQILYIHCPPHSYPLPRLHRMFGKSIGQQSEGSSDFGQVPMDICGERFWNWRCYRPPSQEGPAQVLSLTSILACHSPRHQRKSLMLGSALVSRNADVRVHSIS